MTGLLVRWTGATVRAGIGERKRTFGAGRNLCKNAEMTDGCVQIAVGRGTLTTLFLKACRF
jgi:hypothetical protein